MITSIKKNIPFILFILGAIIVVFFLIGAKLGIFGESAKIFTLGTTIVSFPYEEVVITAEDLQKMTNDELIRYGILLYYGERFHMTQEETHYMGVRLLPRFFATPQPNVLQGAE